MGIFHLKRKKITPIGVTHSVPGFWILVISWAPVYKRQISRSRGGDNRTFAFKRRILVPAAVLLAFLEGFCMFHVLL